MYVKKYDWGWSFRLWGAVLNVPLPLEVVYLNRYSVEVKGATATVNGNRINLKKNDTSRVVIFLTTSQDKRMCSYLIEVDNVASYRGEIGGCVAINNYPMVV